MQGMLTLNANPTSRLTSAPKCLRRYLRSETPLSLTGRTTEIAFPSLSLEDPLCREAAGTLHTCGAHGVKVLELRSTSQGE